MTEKELPEGKMHITSWVKEQVSTLEELILSVERKVNKLLERYETTKGEHTNKIDVLESDVEDVKTSVNVILDSMKK